MRNLLFLILIISTPSFAKQSQIINDITRAAKVAGIDANLLLAVCWAESSYRGDLKPRIDGHSNSYGICQVKLETAEHMDKIYKHAVKATAERLQEPFVNAFYAAKVIKFQLQRYHGDLRKAIEAYNKGHAVSNGNGKYVNKVFKLAQLDVPVSEGN